MNICPVLQPVERTTKGAIAGADDQSVELTGLGRVGMARRRVRLTPAMRRAMLARRFRGRGRAYLSMPPAFGVQLYGFDGPFDDDQGLGKLRRRHGGLFSKVGKGLRKVVKSKLFKYAAIGTAAYFTGGAALKFAAAHPGGSSMFSRLFKSKTAKQVVPGLLAAQQGLPDVTGQGQGLYPGAPSYGYGGGGGGGGTEIPDSEVETPTDQAGQPLEAGMGIPGLGGGALMVVGLGALVLLAGKSKGRGRRRRR